MIKFASSAIGRANYCQRQRRLRYIEEHGNQTDQRFPHQSGEVAPRLRGLLAATWVAAMAARRSAPPTPRNWTIAGEKLLKTNREEIVRGFGLLLSMMQQHEEVLKRLLRAQRWDNSG
jgi:hypothetical protein